jgi:hypothetical protein
MQPNPDPLTIEIERDAEEIDGNVDRGTGHEDG